MDVCEPERTYVMALFPRLDRLSFFNACLELFANRVHPLYPYTGAGHTPEWVILNGKWSHLFMAPLGAGVSELMACQDQTRRAADYPPEGGWAGTQPGKGEKAAILILECGTFAK